MQVLLLPQEGELGQYEGIGAGAAPDLKRKLQGEVPWPVLQIFQPRDKDCLHCTVFSG